MINWRLFVPVFILIILAGAVAVFQRQHSTNPLSLGYGASATPTSSASSTTSSSSPSPTASPSTTPAVVNAKTTIATTVTDSILQQALSAADSNQVDTTSILGDEQSASAVDTTLNANQNGL